MLMSARFAYHYVIGLGSLTHPGLKSPLMLGQYETNMTLWRSDECGSHLVAHMESS